MTHYTSYDLIEWGKPFEKRQNALPEPTGPEVLVRVTAAAFVIQIFMCRKVSWIWDRKVN